MIDRGCLGMHCGIFFNKFYRLWFRIYELLFQPTHLLRTSYHWVLSTFYGHLNLHDVHPPIQSLQQRWAHGNIRSCFSIIHTGHSSSLAIFPVIINFIDSSSDAILSEKTAKHGTIRHNTNYYVVAGIAMQMYEGLAVGELHQKLMFNSCNRNNRNLAIGLITCF